MVKHYHAGYITDIIAKLIDKSDNQTLGLLKHITSFDVTFPDDITSDENNYNPVLAVLNNIICRGLPTKAPLLIEEKLAEALSFSIKNTEKDKEYEELFVLTKDAKLDSNILFELLHIIEPQNNISRAQYDSKLDSHAEWVFINEDLKNKPYTKQILQPQREMFGGDRTVDFAFQSPYSYIENEKKHNFIIEIDGVHHNAAEIKFYDKYRDSLAKEEDFKTYRKPLTESSKKLDVTKIFNGEIFNVFEKNYNRNIADFLETYIAIFTPLAVARIQKTLIEYFLGNIDLLKKETIYIAVIERDVPCAALAIQSLKEYFINLNAILVEENQLHLPKIEVSIIPDERFNKYNNLHLGEIITTLSIDETKFDIIIDHAILRRSGIFKEDTYIFSKAIKIRSSHFNDTGFGQSRRVYCTKPLKYKTLVERNADGSYTDIEKTAPNINFFIKEIFRKTKYREGQLPIISRALNQLPVIGLLPTGGGKSITFQLPALLQPGLCLVINPIKSLMEDQVRVLKNNWIDTCSYINSTLKREEKVKNLIDFIYGESQFMFVSPERFVMEEFRKIINNINSHFGLAITYCVIDEVHCVSEWGHDFRTTYLSLGKNAQKFCTTRNENGKVSLIGLTATASFDVLADIDRELQIDHDDIANATIMIENTIRPELFFSVTDIGEITHPDTKAKIHEIRNLIGTSKQKALNKHFGSFIKILQSIDNKTIRTSLEHHFKDFELISSERTSEKIDEFAQKLKIEEFPTDDNRFSSVHFCPHKSGALGVTNKVKTTDNPKELFENLNTILKGFYMGSSDDEGIEARAREGLEKEANEHLHKFLEGEIKHMVCTKAFGMGIDKQDIRAVYHINFSSSPESYIQEAGRAGRDKKTSICHLLYSNQTFFEIDKKAINNAGLTIEERKKLRSLLENIWKDKDGHKINGIFDYQYFTKEALENEIKQLGFSEEKTSKLLKEIVEINTDKSVHDFFQDNSFKGNDAEINQIWKLLNTDYGYFNTKLKEIENEYNDGDDRIVLNMTVGGDWEGMLWIKDSDDHALGKIQTKDTELKPILHGLGKKGKPDLEITKSILNVINEKHQEYLEKNDAISLFDFLNITTDKKLNGDDGSLIQKWDKVENTSFTYKFPQNPENDDFIERIMTCFKVEEKHKANLFKIYEKSIDFTDFIHRIEEYLWLNITDSAFYKNEREKLKQLYDQQISKGYTARLIYRLMQIGMISDYTIDYRLKIFNCTFEKLTIEDFVKNTELFLAKYTSKEGAKEERMKLEANIGRYEKEFDKSFLCLGTVIQFTYKEVVAKRKNAVTDLQVFIKDSICRAKKKENVFAYKDYWYDYYFKEEMYYYFNAKYARNIFNLTRKVELNDGKFEVRSIDYSLLKATDEGKKSEWATFEKFAEVIGVKGGFIADAKMMRGSCRKIWRNMVSSEEEKEWVLKLLYAYSTYCLNDNYYIHEANERFIQGFTIYIEVNKEGNYEDFKYKVDKFSEFVKKHVNTDKVKENYHRAKELLLFQAQLKYTNELITKHQLKLKEYGTI